MPWTQRPNENWRKTSRRTLDRARTLRREPTESEAQLWKLLRTLKSDGVHFRRQANVGGHVFDFAALARRLLIELDGGVHNAPDVALRDEAKQKWAEEAGYRVLRIKNEELRNEESVLARVRLALRAPHPFQAPPPLPLPQGGGE